MSDARAEKAMERRESILENLSQKAAEVKSPTGGIMRRGWQGWTPSLSLSGTWTMTPLSL